MVVTQLINSKGNAVKNQFVIFDNGNIYFKSYNSTIAKITLNKNLILGKHWNYSNTTLKHLYEFLRQNNMPELASKQALKNLIDKNKITVIDKQNFE